MLEYIATITRASRTHPSLILGCSPRASAQLLKVSKTVAAIRGRDFVIPDDVQDIAGPALRHRLLLRPDAEIEGIEPDDIIEQIIAGIPVPRTEEGT